MFFGNTLFFTQQQKYDDTLNRDSTLRVITPINVTPTAHFNQEAESSNNLYEVIWR